MKHLKLVSLFLLLLVLGMMNIVAQDGDTIADVIAMTDESDEVEFTTLLTLITDAGLVPLLVDAEAELTLFAPTDEAFDALLEEFDLTLDDLLSAPDLMASILLYHVADGIISADELSELETVPTVKGDEIAVSVDEGGNVILDAVAMIVVADIEASNGTIHMIDAVLIPPDDGVADSVEACIVRTSLSDTVRVRVGPGTNRTSVTFLPANQDFEPLGQATDDDGNIWYQLDKEEAATGRAINEAWVAADELLTSGDCSAVGESAPPPIIPIISAPPPAPPETDSSDGGDTSTTETGTLPLSGTYTLTLSSNSNVSCEGTTSVVFPSTELYNSLTLQQSVRSSAQADYP
ncbi:MAG: fasciclin domain-containing protein [Anaerolineae bacterium]|nr:fasciclin domain-containing protein [Anaerolineae bacterium]